MTVPFLVPAAAVAGALKLLHVPRVLTAGPYAGKRLAAAAVALFMWLQATTITLYGAPAKKARAGGGRGK